MRAKHLNAAVANSRPATMRILAPPAFMDETLISTQR